MTRRFYLRPIVSVAYDRHRLDSEHSGAQEKLCGRSDLGFADVELIDAEAEPAKRVQLIPAEGAYGFANQDWYHPPFHGEEMWQTFDNLVEPRPDYAGLSMDRPRIMGIVNVTPDSFSSDGLAGDPEAAVALGIRMAEDGADILDVGGESTRPGSDPVAEDEELRRVIPVVEALARRVRTPISIDTRRARVAREALAAGACVVNDVTALRGDPAMAATVAKSGAAVVLMHMQGEPKTMQDRPVYDNLMADICRFLRQSMALAAEAGVPEEKILVDPGIGFGKTLADNLQVLARLGQLRTLGLPILIGPSRKRFIGELTGIETPAERTYGTAAACALAVAAGALVLRVHDVRPVRQALAVAAAVVHVDEKTP